MGTFSNEDDLPSLPLPPLDDTLDLYLETARPHLSESEFGTTEAVVNKFRASERARRLQNALEDRCATHRNWLEEWWLDRAYLRTRQSLVPTTNFALVWSGMEMPVPYQKKTERSRAFTAAAFLHHILRYWQKLTAEEISAESDAKGKPFSMRQLRFLLNTCRIPGLEKDSVLNHFAVDGSAPRHIIATCGNRFFKVVPFDCDGDDLVPWPVKKLEAFFLQLEKFVESNSRDDTVSVGHLTGADRTSWAKLRGRLAARSARNAEYLCLIESSICSIVLDDGEPADDVEFFKSLTFNTASNYWNDKSVELVATRNGLFGSHSEHSPMDGIAFTGLCGGGIVGASKVFDSDEADHGDNSASSFGPFNFEELRFDIADDDRSVFADEIEVTKLRLQSWIDGMEVCHRKFAEFGKERIKATGIHPDTFLQVALQVAIYLTHKRPFPTYETATTRYFYHGRTETVRSCTREALELARAVVAEDGAGGGGDLGPLLDAAVARHDHLMDLCKRGLGCDRHLLGIMVAAAEEEDEDDCTLPEVFTDPAFAKSGGNGNFSLSTSLAGYSAIIGGCPPMTRDGYGCFYSVPRDHIMIFTSSYSGSQVTDPVAFWDNIQVALRKVVEIAESKNR